MVIKFDLLLFQFAFQAGNIFAGDGVFSPTTSVKFTQLLIDGRQGYSAAPSRQHREPWLS